MTAERTVGVNELGANISPFRNYAVAFYDARGARTYARVWKTTTPGVDAVDRTAMRIAAGGLVYKLLYSAAQPNQFPQDQDLLMGSLTLSILPNGSGAPVNVRLLQIDIAVKDERADATGWYFATYAYDRTVAGDSVLAQDGSGRSDVGQRSRQPSDRGIVDQSFSPGVRKGASRR